MPHDYIPDSDSELQAWQRNFVEYATAHAADLGLTAADIAALADAQAGWDAAYPAHVVAHNAAKAACTAKDEARAYLVAAMRALAQRVQAAPTVTDDLRAGLGLNVPSRTLVPVSAPPGRPLARVDASQRFRHTIHFTDEGSPTRKARPEGVIGAEVWMKVGDPAPRGPSETVYVALATHTPWVLEFGAAEVGKPVHYLLRWVSRRGERGPWSETVVATVHA